MLYAVFGSSLLFNLIKYILALVIAALTAEGYSTVEDIKYIERGYEDFDVKLRELGAQIEKVDSDREITKFKLKHA